MHALNKNKHLLRFLGVFCVLALCLGVQFYLAKRQKAFDDLIADEMDTRQRCIMVIDEFRLVDQQLTRFARAFCATKDDSYLKNYYHIYEWSSGQVPRPKELNSQLTLGVVGATISQLNMLRKLDVASQILDYFQRALEYSDLLATFEDQAIKSIQEGVIVEGPAQPIQDETPQAFAQRVLYEAAYQDRADQIADNLGKFVNLYYWESAKKITDYRQNLDRAYVLAFFAQIFTILLIGLLFGRLFQVFQREESVMLDAMEDRDIRISTMEYSMLMLENEMKVAGKIQQEFLPPSFDTSHGTTIWGQMIPAKATGGDFYDYYWLDPNHLGVTIGDVSGKGMPAAMFMSRTLTLFRAGIAAMNEHVGYDTGRLVHWMNRQLTIRNEQSMFVTLFVGVLNKEEGVFQYCNAGHHFAILVHHEGNIETVHTDPDLVVGIDSSAQYREYTVPLNPGDTLILYTDGIVEAISSKGELYGTPRLHDLIQQANVSQQTAKFVADLLVEHVHQFAEGAVQSDDITVLVLKNE